VEIWEGGKFRAKPEKSRKQKKGGGRIRGNTKRERQGGRIDEKKKWVFGSRGKGAVTEHFRANAREAGKPQRTKTKGHEKFRLGSD